MTYPLVSSNLPSSDQDEVLIASTMPSFPSSKSSTLPIETNPEGKENLGSASHGSSEGSNPFHLLNNRPNCCRICLDDDPHGLYSPCRCRGSIKFVHSHCLTRWRKSLMAHGRDETANSCTMCGFNYVLKKRARFYELISYRAIRVAITFLFVLAMMFPSGYVMKACVLLSGHGQGNATDGASITYLQSLRNIPTDMDEMIIFPICKAGSSKLSFKKPSAILIQKESPTVDYVSAKMDNSDVQKPGGSKSALATSPSHFISIFPGPYVHTKGSPSSQEDSTTSSSSDSNTHQNFEPSRMKKASGKSSPFESSWARLAAGIDIMGSSEFASMLLYPFAGDRLLYYMLCRLQHLHLGFFLLGSASNVYMAFKMFSDMYDLLITPPHSRYIKNFFLFQASIFVIWFWFSYNLVAFRVTSTEEEFMNELPLWALRWINVGVAIVDLSYRRVYNRLGRLKVEEELMDISDVEEVEKRQQKAWLSQQQSFLQYSQEQGQYLLDQFKSFEVKQSILNSANAAVDVVSDVYSKSSIPSFPPMPNSLASAVTMLSSTPNNRSGSINPSASDHIAQDDDQ